MLATIPQIQLIPGLNKPKLKPYLDVLVPQADRTIKNWCRRDLELTTYPGAAVNGPGDTGIYSGQGWQDIILRQFPVQNFMPPNSTVQVYFDPNAFGGQNTSNGYTPFAANTLLVQGTQYLIIPDNMEGSVGGQPASSCALLRLIGGYSGFGGGWWGSWGSGQIYATGAGGGKLAGSRQPGWPYGQGNIKVVYQAGYANIPLDLVSAMGDLVAWFIRNQPSGSPLSSENLGSYGYSVMSAGLGSAPELGSLRQKLTQYRDITMGGFQP